ncbi:MAG: FHA domain-containing protein [Planctomycetota bacterium]
MADRFILILEGGARSGERIPISGDRFTIGRKPGNSLVLQDASVSGNHSELLKTAEGYLIRDVGSTNGTFVGGNKISLPTTIKIGDRFALGSVPMRIENEAALAAAKEVDEISLDAAPASSGELDLIEDEPTGANVVTNVSAPPVSPAPSSRTAAPKAIDQTLTMASAAASAMSVRTGGGGTVISTGADAEPIITDSQTLDRARKAAAEQSKRGRLLIIAGGVAALGALGAAGYLLFLNDSGGAGPRPKAVRTVAGNLLSNAAASFEDDASAAGRGWLLRDGTYEIEGINSAGFANTSRKVASGVRAVEARLDGPSAARATSEFVNVQAGQTLQIAAHVLAERANGMLQMIFRGRGAVESTSGAMRIVKCGPVAHSSGAGAAGGGFTRIAGDVTVPAGCTQAALSFVAAGGEGNVLFDDAEIVISPNPAAAPVMKREIEFDGELIDGRVRKIDKNFIHSMGIVMSGMLADAPAARARIWTAGRGPDGFELFGPSGSVGKVNLTLTATETQVVYSYKPAGLTGNAALTWTLDRAYAPEITVRGSKVSGRYRGEFTEPACEWMVFGEETNRLKISFEPPAAVRAVPEGNTFRLEIDLKAELKANIQFSFDAEKRRALDLEQQADAAQKDNKLGESIRLRAQIIDEFPFDRVLVERNEQKRDAELAKGQKLAAEIEKRVADAEFFKIPQAFRDARNRAEKQLLVTYSGTDVEERAKTVIASVEKSLAATEAELGERDALRLLTIASAFDAANAKNLSGYVRDYLKKYYPGTRAAQGSAK